MLQGEHESAKSPPWLLNFLLLELVDDSENLVNTIDLASPSDRQHVVELLHVARSSDLALGVQRPVVIPAVISPHGLGLDLVAERVGGLAAAKGPVDFTFLLVSSGIQAMPASPHIGSSKVSDLPIKAYLCIAANNYRSKDAAACLAFQLLPALLLLRGLMHVVCWLKGYLPGDIFDSAFSTLEVANNLDMASMADDFD